jgi:hypothetical protein
MSSLSTDLVPTLLYLIEPSWSDVKKAGHQLPVLLGGWSSSDFGWTVAIFPFLSQNGQYLISLTTSTSLSSASYLISSFFALEKRKTRF